MLIYSSRQLDFDSFSFLAHILSLVPSFSKFLKFIYPLILSVPQFNFSEILKMSNHS